MLLTSEWDIFVQLFLTQYGTAEIELNGQAYVITILFLCAHPSSYLLLQLEKGGFSISATKRKLASSLVIGPGSGYNLVSIDFANFLTFSQ